MDMDLSRALHDAAQTGTAHRTPIAAGPVLQRIRRRRNARIAVESTVGVAAAGAVAVGAVQITGMRGVEPRPVPPATSSPTPTPTPAPTPSAGPDFPTAVTAAEPLVCDVLPKISDPAGDAELRFEPRLIVDGAAAEAPADGSGIALTLGESIAVEPVLVNGTDAALDAAGMGEPQVWFVQADGTVAGRLRTTEPGLGTTLYTGGPGARFSGRQLSGIPADCSSVGDTADPLAAGAYDVYVVQQVLLSDGGDTSRLVTGAPVPVTIAEPVVEEPEAPPADPEPGPHPDLEDLVISPAGLGPLAVGVPLATNPGAAMIELDPDYCDPEVFPETDPGRYIPSGYPLEERDGDLRQAFHVDADSDGVYRIDVMTSAIETAEGVRVGSTLSELQAAYPQLEGPFGDATQSRVWWLTGPTGVLVFETMAEGADGMPSADAPEKVIIMRVLVAGADPKFTAANSDNVAGSCL